MTTEQTAFFPSLEEFSSKFLIVGSKEPTPEEFASVPEKSAELERSIFEQLLLFDRLAIKVRGENLPLVMMLQFFGERTLEELIDQSAFRFVQWTSLVFHMVTDVPGVDALAAGGVVTSVAHDDPEQSIDLALKRLTRQPADHVKKMLRKKVPPLYQATPNDLAAEAVKLTKSAYNSGKLTAFDLPPDESFDRLPLPKRAALGKCASEISEYNYAVANQMTSLSNYAYFSLLTETADKLAKRRNLPYQFNELAKIEAIPDLKSLFPQLADPMRQLPTVRAKSSSYKFRQWLAHATEGGAEISTEYVSAIANVKGPFDTKTGKFLKAIALTGIGTAAGAAVGGVAGAVLAGSAAGAAIGKIAEPAVDVALDLLDEFVLDGLVRGWSPRMFFDDLRKLEHRDLRGS